jgi:DNA-binding transcriptional regulator YhcF (GntR family)
MQCILKGGRQKLEWNFDNQKPIYSQLIDQIQLGILAGEFTAGTAIPSVRILAVEAGVNPNTMQRARAELETAGLLFSQRTAGRFVTEDRGMIERIKKQKAEMYIANFFEGMKTLGFDRTEALRLLTETKDDTKEERDE